ncbi:unnamed protein product, partial [Amoebophrya sp. A120]
AVGAKTRESRRTATAVHLAASPATSFAPSASPTETQFSQSPRPSFEDTAATSAPSSVQAKPHLRTALQTSTDHELVDEFKFSISTSLPSTSKMKRNEEEPMNAAATDKDPVVGSTSTTSTAVLGPRRDNIAAIAGGLCNAARREGAANFTGGHQNAGPADSLVSICQNNDDRRDTQSICSAAGSQPASSEDTFEPEFRKDDVEGEGRRWVDERTPCKDSQLASASTPTQSKLTAGNGARTDTKSVARSDLNAFSPTAVSTGSPPASSPGAAPTSTDESVTAQPTSVRRPKYSWSFPKPDLSEPLLDPVAEVHRRLPFLPKYDLNKPPQLPYCPRTARTDELDRRMYAMLAEDEEKERQSALRRREAEQARLKHAEAQLTEESQPLEQEPCGHYSAARAAVAAPYPLAPRDDDVSEELSCSGTPLNSPERRPVQMPPRTPTGDREVTAPRTAPAPSTIGKNRPPSAYEEAMAAPRTLNASLGETMRQALRRKIAQQASLRRKRTAGTITAEEAEAQEDPVFNRAYAN